MHKEKSTRMRLDGDSESILLLRAPFTGGPFWLYVRNTIRFWFGFVFENEGCIQLNVRRSLQMSGKDLFSLCDFFTYDQHLDEEIYCTRRNGWRLRFHHGYFSTVEPAFPAVPGKKKPRRSGVSNKWCTMKQVSQSPL